MSDYSDTESVNSTFSESLQTTDIYDSLELGKDPNAYKKDKNCTGCNCKFGKIGIAHARKHYCKFCYRGVCAKCSPQMAFHPVKQSKLRICNACCNKAALNKASENFRLDIDVERQRKEHLFKEHQLLTQENENIRNQIQEIEKNMEQEQLQELKMVETEKLIFNLDRKLRDKTEIQNKLIKENKENKNQLAVITKSLTEAENELKKIREDEENNRQEIFRLKNLLGDKNDEKIIIKKKIDEERQKRFENEEKRADFEKEEKLRTSFQEVQSIITQLLKEKDEIVKSISGLTDENSGLAVDIQNLKKTNSEDSLIPSASSHKFSEEEEEKFRRLKQLQKEKRATIESLKIELKKKEPKSEDPSDYELTSTDKTRPCARCRIF